jgi:hypothetical protein
LDDFETQKTLQNQLATALNAAKRSLGSEQKTRKVEKDKMVKDTEAKVAEQVRLEQEGRDSRGAAALLHAKHAKAFSAPWKDAGHPEVRVVQFKALEGEIFTKKCADPFAEPFICKGYMVDPESALGKTMVSWKTAFSLKAEKKGQDKCQAPMTSVHHVDDTSLLLKAVFPEKYHVKHLLPSVEKMCEHVFMYGYSENMTSYDFEPGALGCTRWVHSGSVAMLLVPAVDLAMNLAKVQKIEGKVMLADMKKWVESIDTVDWTVPQLQDLRSKGIRIFHCKLGRRLHHRSSGFRRACLRLEQRACHRHSA